MKNCYLFVLAGLLCAAFTLHAQPTLTEANIVPQPGESFSFESISIMGLSAGNTGANQTWNFGTVASNGNATASYVVPSTTPSGSSFPSSTVSLALAPLYDYYASDVNSYARVGADNGSQLITYSDPQIQLSFPMTYGTMFVDSFAATLSGIVPIQRSGIITVEADGYGTLTTPQGTFQNVLRIKFVEDYEDEINGTVVSSYDSEIYGWYLPGTHYPIFSMTSLTVSGAGTTSYGSYLNAVSVSTPEALALASDVKLFPNPASTEVTLDYALSQSEDLRLRLLTATGQEIRRQDLGKLAPGKYQETLNLDGLAAGMYLIRLENGEGAQTRKLLVR